MIRTSRGYYHDTKLTKVFDVKALRVLTKRAVDEAIAKEAVDFNQANQAMDDVQDASELMDAVRMAVHALDCSIQSILYDDEVTDKQAAIESTYEQFEAYLDTLCPDEDEDDKTEKNMSGVTALNPAIQKAIEEAVTKVASEKDTQIAKLQEELAVAKMSDKHKSYHDGLGDAEKKKFQSMTPEERDAAMEKTMKRAEDDPIYKAMRSENDDLRKRLEKIEQERDLEVCKRDAKAMGMTQNDAGEVLMKSRRGDAEAHKKLEGYMLDLAKRKTAIETTSKVFEEFGTANTGQTGVNAVDEITAKAAELRKADPSLTEAKAFEKVYLDPANKELMVREQRERMSKIHRVA